jgi:hypothetical protein
MCPRLASRQRQSSLGWQWTGQIGPARRATLPASGRCSWVCSRDTLKAAGRGDTGRDGTTPSVLLSGPTPLGVPPANITRVQFRSRCTTAASLRALAHEAVVSENGPHPPVKAEPNGATGCERHPHRPCHKRATHNGPERSPSGQPRTTANRHRPARLHASAGDSRGRSGFASRRSARAVRPSNRAVLRAFRRLLKSGLLAICWQQPSQRDAGNLFVLVGVTGFEPVASAV